jgi:hypothetical protein
MIDLAAETDPILILIFIVVVTFIDLDRIFEALAGIMAVAISSIHILTDRFFMIRQNIINQNQIKIQAYKKHFTSLT